MTWGANANRWVAVSWDGTGASRLMSSTDGISWSLGSFPLVRNWNNVVYGGASGQETFVALAGSLASGGYRVATSVDGVSWTARVTPADIAWAGLAWGNASSTYVAVSQTATAAGQSVMMST